MGKMTLQEGKGWVVRGIQVLSHNPGRLTLQRHQRPGKVMGRGTSFWSDPQAPQPPTQEPGVGVDETLHQKRGSRRSHVWKDG